MTDLDAQTASALASTLVKLDRYRRALLDAAVMFENIERNRNMPPFANTLQQYVAMGRSIKKLLAEG